MKNGPLDMRMGAGSVGGLTAADICNEFDVKELSFLMKKYGDEPRANVIARSIAQHRPLSTTGDLMEAVAAVTPQFAKQGRRKGRTATLARVFQSLRIVVNDEEAALGEALMSMAPTLVRPGGRLVILSYHSMEDRAAKRVLRDGILEKVRTAPPRDMYGNYMGTPKPWKGVGKRCKATVSEIESNPRARSANLRIGERSSE
jgi:16S rRNA (cytosine1402-N4)-methyltransferase